MARGFNWDKERKMKQMWAHGHEWVYAEFSSPSYPNKTKADKRNAKQKRRRKRRRKKHKQ